MEMDSALGKTLTCYAAVWVCMWQGSCRPYKVGSFRWELPVHHKTATSPLFRIIMSFLWDFCVTEVN